MNGTAADRRPPQWQRHPPRRRIASLLVLALATLLCAAMGGLAAVRGDAATAGLLLAGAPSLAAFTAIGAGMTLPRRRSGEGRLRAADYGGRPALVFPYARWLETVAVFGLVSMVLLLAALAAVAAGSLSAVLLAVLGVALLPLLGGIATGRVHRGEVALDPTGIRHRSWAFTTYTPWTAVQNVRADYADGPLLVVITTVAGTGSTVVEQRTRLWRQPELAFLPYIAIRGALLATDPTLLWHAFAYYATHPDARSELAGPPAAARDF